MIRQVSIYRNRLLRNAAHLKYPVGQIPNSIARYYSIKPPVYKKSGNILVNALNYVRDVEQYQEELSKSASEKLLAEQLLDRIEDQPELLYLLLIFHRELSKIGITPTSSREFSKGEVWKYRLVYVLKLAKIHNIFWTQCQYFDISEQPHKLGFLPSEIGVLDPKNFDLEAYHQLQQGSYKENSFKDIEVLGVGNFK